MKKSVDWYVLTLVSMWVQSHFFSSAVFANTNRNTTLSYYHVSGLYILGSSVHISTGDIPSALPGASTVERVQGWNIVHASVACTTRADFSRPESCDKIQQVSIA